MNRPFLLACSLLALTGCSTAQPTGGSGGSDNHATEAYYSEQAAIRGRADYWQRADTVSAQYMTGPKAQHQLNKDIASCVAQTRELVRLGSIRKASPPATVGMSPGLQAGWQSPTRDGPLFTEYTDFQDFDGCMKYNGWERVDYVRPAVAKSASTNYMSTILGHPFGWWSTNDSPDNDSSQDRNFNQ